ncbi:major facilitator superfamily domain-containing protein [Xylaria arbuscula]|nr:major facilitator superfamily domain-containing protein [Xylaria arbuscula]
MPASNSNESLQTSVSGRATPTSDSFSSADTRASSNRRRPAPLELDTADYPGSRGGLHAAAAATVHGHDDGDDESYELDEFSGEEFDENAVDDEEDEDEDEEDEDARMMRGRSGSSRKQNVNVGRRMRRSRRRPSESTVASFQLYTPDEERAVVRKFDRRLVVFLAFCYMLSFVDRSNIGNARIAGMEADLQSRPPREDYFEWALRAFYIAYITFEWMSLLWRLVPAHIYVSLIVLSWGVIASLQAVVTSYPVLIFLRGILGIGEAGFTGVPFYLSFFFKRRELAFRTALFISAAPLASAFAGFLAWLILWIGKSLPIASWRLLFLIEGFPSIVVATIAWGVIPDSPETASYLSPRERKIARLRLRHEKAQQHSHERSSSPGHTEPKQPSSGLKAKEVLAAFKDPKAWVTAFMFFFANMAYSTLPAFLPTILQEMGHSKLQAEALTVPPNLLAFGIVLVTAHVSDRVQSRSPYIVAHALLSASGYLVLALAGSGSGMITPAIRYAAVYPAAIGFFSVVVLIIAWSVNNQPGEGRRGGGFALLQVVGQCGPLLGAQLYPDRDAPFFRTGMWACCAAMFTVALLAVVLRLYLTWLNRRLDEDEARGDGGEEEEEVRGLVGERGKEGGGFRFIL